ncbi:MAG: DUF4065 domain-containing protein [Desulfovibrio sp.]|nr:DUF4065 domain-containing protein [Desulfovibrio sp.]
MATVFNVSDYFLAELTPENDITNLKLQKLCAYAQAMSLALLGESLFVEDLEAWTHGPVIPSLYRRYEQFGRRPLPSSGLSEAYARKFFEDKQKFVLELAKSYYGQFSAWELRQRSHRDFPGNFGSKEVISKEAIKKAFASDPLIVKLREGREQPSDRTIVSEQEFLDALAI